MPKTKIAVTVESRVLARLDEIVRDGGFRNRSQAVEAAIAEKLARLDRSRLVRECAKLDSAYEKALAEEGMGEDLAGWPEY